MNGNDQDQQHCLYHHDFIPKNLLFIGKLLWLLGEKIGKPQGNLCTSPFGKHFGQLSTLWKTLLSKKFSPFRNSKAGTPYISFNLWGIFQWGNYIKTLLKKQFHTIFYTKISLEEDKKRSNIMAQNFFPINILCAVLDLNHLFTSFTTAVLPFSYTK